MTTPCAFSDLAQVLEAENAAWNEAKERARSGKKVLVATNLPGHWASVLETSIAVALTLRGADVHFLVCDSMMSACQLVSPKDFGQQSDLEKIIEDERLASSLCRNCKRKLTKRILPLGLKVHRYSELVPQVMRSRIRELARQTSLDDIRSFRVEGQNLGQHALAGALRFYARGDLPETRSAETVLRRYFESALMAYHATDALLKGQDFAVAVFHHGIYVPQGPTAIACRLNGVRIVNSDASYRDGTFIYSHNDTYHFEMMNEPTDQWTGLDLRPVLRKEILDYLRSRASGQLDWIKFHEAPDFEVKKRLDALGIDRNRPVYGLLTNVIWDAQLHFPQNAFTNMMEWIIATIAYFERNPDKQLIIRVHPAEITGWVPSRQKVMDEILERFPTIPGNVHIVDSDDACSTYELMKICDPILIYGTKMGVELAAQGKTVIVAGEAWVRNKGITIDVSSKEEFLQMLDRNPSIRDRNPDFEDHAIKYAYHFFFRRMIPLPFMVIKPKWGVRISGLSDLRAGHHKGLDVVCDGILNGTEFVYPYERYARGPDTRSWPSRIMDGVRRWLGGSRAAASDRRQPDT